MSTRSRTVIIGGGFLVQNQSSREFPEQRYEFAGNGLTAITVRDSNGEPVFCDPDSVKLFVFGQLKSVSEYTVEQNENGTILTPTKPLPLPRPGAGSNCVVFYRSL
jgi:hypothetical protein